MGLQIKQNKTMLQEKKADIMFCIDNSSSMQDCIDGVRDTVNNFVKTLEEGIQGFSPVDWEIGLLNYSNYEFRFCRSFKRVLMISKRSLTGKSKVMSLHQEPLTMSSVNPIGERELRESSLCLPTRN